MKTLPTDGSRPLRLCLLAAGVALLATGAAHVLLALIGGITQLAFFGRWSTELTSAAGHTRGVAVILIPALGGGLIALLARYGSRAIIGHGIPEVMEQVLVNRSRIAPRVAILKPLSSALSIGTGGPYGAEGPVIATGGAVGSLLGQALTMTAVERKILLAAGATAAMTAVFGSPVAATLLAVELLLFEFKARSVVPVALAAAIAQACRLGLGEPAALFHLEPFAALSATAILPFAVIGIGAGALSVGATSAVHGVEAFFARLPVSWMWRPVIGGLVVGLIGWREPRIFGAGYDVIGGFLENHFTLATLGMLGAGKLLAWVVSLGSGTSGGTLAPMLIIGGSFGALAAAGISHLGGVEVPLGLAALTGMVAFFAGGSRAFFASIILGVEITQNAGALWPAALAATTALLTARLLSRHSIMTAPVEQRGVRVPVEFDADVFAHVTVGAVMEPAPQTISETMLVGALADRIGAHDPEVSHHQALLLTDDTGAVKGILTRRDLLTAVERGDASLAVSAIASAPLVTAYPDEALHEAIDRMHHHGIGRLPVVNRERPDKLVGYLGRAAILSARRLRWHEEHQREPGWLSRKQPDS